MYFYPQIHPATSPCLKDGSVYHRLLPFSIEPQRDPHIGTSHWHNFTQLWYTFSGSFAISIDGKESTQQPGQLTIIPPYKIHMVDSSESDPGMRHICISLYDDLFENNIAPLFAVSHNRVIFEDKVLPSTFIFKGEEKERADEIFANILAEFSRHHDMNRSSIYRNITAALSMLAEHSASTVEPSVISREIEQINLIHSATDYISKNYHSDISIDTLSSRMLMSQSSFSNKFKHTTGQTFLSYCKKTKMARAIWLLRLSKQSLAEIADECGFYDSTHLSHAIKSSFGASPLALRDQMIEQNRTYGLARHLKSMERIAWMNVMTKEEIAYFRRCAIGMPD